MESLGFSQTTDSFVEGTLADMVFYNPVVAPGKRFVIETKADELTLKSGILARELVTHFRTWQSQEPEDRFGFWLFIQGLKRSKEWESMFSEINDIDAISVWSEWYNEKYRKDDEPELEGKDIQDIAKFFASSKVTVATSLELELAVIEKKETSISHISRYAEKLLGIVGRRKSPIRNRSKLIMNILPIKVPDNYYTCQSTADNKPEIYEALEGITAPPFLFSKEKIMATFSKFDENNPLTEFSKSSADVLNTKDMQIQNPTLASQIIHIHLRRIIWNRGIWYDRDARVFYYPMLDEKQDVRRERSYTGNLIWVTKKYVHQEDTTYARKGETNFYRHRAFTLRTPTYWDESYIEINPKRYYTKNGKNPMDGEIRSKIDARFRRPEWDRSKNRLRLMKFWKYVIFDSTKWAIPSEPWVEDFEFGAFLTESVRWSPQVVGRDQTILWDYQVMPDG